MPVIVAFGDSNAWGYDPATGGRFPRPQRWPSVLQRELGADFEVIAARGAGEARGGRQQAASRQKTLPRPRRVPRTRRPKVS
jgi:lysophospholipase L1-like esterase